MFIYFTSGTADYMEKMRKKYASEKVFILHGEGNTVLVHESEKKSIFATPRKYEVLDSVGELQQKGYFVLNNIPVSDEGRPIFENRFLNRAGSIDKEPGFIAFRLLRPLDSNTYIVMTQWAGPASFEAWKTSQAFKQAHSNKGEATGVMKQNIFNAASYVTKYSAPPDEE
ncbi:antibiotic biosynthesis monooxygenase [Solibacillus sp. CAU 1738]|uniref:antibiotic biosynthesis monooxygenase family protein n=1 Tax=Solibacillus sp. CAU 1738 TaxID=3140363 RepID=UPI0032607EEE